MTFKNVLFVTSCLVLSLHAEPSKIIEEVPKYRNDYSFVAEANLFFKEHYFKESFGNAVSKCFAEGASLLIPKTKEVAQAALRFKTNTSSVLWLGIHDMFSEGEFVTLYGKELSSIYFNWKKNEPNNANGKENCIIMGSDGTYNDIDCKMQFSFICEKDLTNIQKNVICNTYDYEYVHKSETDHCYKVHRNPRNWHDAYKICKAEQSRMAIINSEQEAMMFVKMMEENPADGIHENFDKFNVFLGFTDLISSGLFLTIDGQTLLDTGYDIWGEGQPDNLRYNEHCGGMLLNGKLNDLSCTVRAMFICEKTLEKPTESTSNTTNDFTPTSA